MGTLKTISAALKLVEAKKENLKKAYDDLQAHSSLLSSFPLTWSHLDSHFTSIHNSLSQRFLHLQSLESQQQKSSNHNPNPPLPSPSNSPLQNPKNSNFTPISNDASPSSNPTPQNGTVANPAEQLRALCKNMDGKGLRDYVGDHFKDRDIIKVELRNAFNCASDPASMVLDSLDGVVGASAVKDEKELRKMKRNCNILFQQLRVAFPNVKTNFRKKAKRLAVEWKGSLVNENADAVGAMAFLHFVAAYGLLSELTMNELATFSAMAAANDDLPELYQIIGLTDKVPGLVQKLIDKGKHILAVKYVFQFNLVDKMPPVPILKAYVVESEKLARRLSQEGKSINEITAREIHALRQVIKVIEAHNLQSEYPPAIIEERIEQVKKHKANAKHATPAFAVKPPQHQHQHSGIKRPRTSAPIVPAAVVNNVTSASSTVQQYQQPHFQSTGLLPEHPNPYMTSPAMPYGMMAPAPTISPYTGPSTGPYGLDGVPVGPSGNLGQGGSHPHSSEPHIPVGLSGNLGQGGSHPHSSDPLMQSGYYDSVSAYGGYGLQYYYQPSYPK